MNGADGVSDIDDMSGVISITLGVDGRLYCHDITPELLPVLSALCGVNAELARRESAGDSLQELE